MWIWLENTALGYWVGGSLWAYPVILCLHAIGLAVAVGIFAMRDLRLLGLFSDIDPRAFLTIGLLGWGGFVINAISGALLFTSQAYTFVHNIPFLLKISFIGLAMILAAIIQARLRSPLTADGEVVIERSTRALALLSLLLWMGAIIAGRLIAYIL